MRNRFQVSKKLWTYSSNKFFFFIVYACKNVLIINNLTYFTLVTALLAKLLSKNETNLR